MTTDTKSVARWCHSRWLKTMVKSVDGDYVEFTDHKKVVAELRSALAAKSAEVEGLRAARIAYANEFPLNEDGEPDVGNIHANIRSLRKDAERYRWLLSQMTVGAVQTQLPLYRAPYLVMYEPCNDAGEIEEAIDEAMKEQAE